MNSKFKRNIETLKLGGIVLLIIIIITYIQIYVLDNKLIGNYIIEIVENIINKFK